MRKVKRKGEQRTVTFTRYISTLAKEARITRGASYLKTQGRMEQVLRARKRKAAQQHHVETQDDPVVQCLNSMKTMEVCGGGSLLTNGKIEMQLKSLMGSAWECGRIDQRAYVMDKVFHVTSRGKGGSRRSKRKTHGKLVMGGLDLLALEGRRPKFWLETKCSFLEDHNDGARNANSALKQADRTKGNLIPALRRCPVYVVHFLNSVPSDAERFPRFVLDKYRKLAQGAKKFRTKRKMTPELFRLCQLEWLRSIYAAHAGDKVRRKYAGSTIISLSPNPLLKALLVKLT